MRVLLIKSADIVCDDHFHGQMEGLSLYIFQTGIYLRNEGLDADVIDNDGSQSIAYGNYDAVCAFVCLPGVFYRDIEYLRRAKEAGKITILFLHNSFGTIEEEIMSDYAFIDYAVVNYDREISLAYLLKKLKGPAASLLGQDCGIVARDGNKIVNYGLRRENHPLEHLVSSVPLLKDINPKVYKRDTVYMRTGRGCPFSCGFCEIRGTAPQKRNIDHIIGEITYLSKYFSHFFFVDPDMSINKDWLTGLCDRLIRECLPITWEGAFRANACNDIGLLRKMKESGCVMLTVGVETLDSSTGEFSDKVNKKISQEMLDIAERNLKKAYIFPLWSFVIGFPWDSKKSMSQVENFIRTRYGTFIVQMLRPFKGSPIYNELKEKGIIEKEFLYKDFIKMNAPLCRTDFLSKEDIYRWYLRLSRVAKSAGIRNKAGILLHDGLMLHNRHNRLRAARFIKNAMAGKG